MLFSSFPFALGEGFFLDKFNLSPQIKDAFPLDFWEAGLALGVCLAVLGWLHSRERAGKVQGKRS